MLKKVISLIIVCLLFISFSITALAAETVIKSGTGKVTFSEVVYTELKTITIYGEEKEVTIYYIPAETTITIDMGDEPYIGGSLLYISISPDEYRPISSYPGDEFAVSAEDFAEFPLHAYFANSNEIVFCMLAKDAEPITEPDTDVDETPAPEESSEPVTDLDETPAPEEGSEPVTDLDETSAPEEEPEPVKETDSEEADPSDEAAPEYPEDDSKPSGDLKYTVKYGDTLGKISLNFYGSYSYHNDLYKANKDIFSKTNGRLNVGMELIIPSNIGNGIIPQPVAGDGETLYTVKAGDTLSKIAAKHYGSSAEYKIIFERNSDRIKNPNLIYEGQIIILPKK